MAWDTALISGDTARERGVETELRGPLKGIKDQDSCTQRMLKIKEAKSFPERVVPGVLMYTTSTCSTSQEYKGHPPPVSQPNSKIILRTQ